MTPTEFQQRLKNLEINFKEFFDKAGPLIAGNTAVSLFKQNFQNEGFFGEGWQEVKRNQNPGDGASSAIYGRKKSGLKKGQEVRPILTKSGDLGRSIEVKEAADGRAVIWTNPEILQSKAPYGRVHNEGLRAGRGSGFIMPKRQFMGEHPQLNQAVIEKLEKKLNEIMNGK